jgi:hypothetical protein
MSQEFCIDKFPNRAKNAIIFYRWSLNKLMIQYETREISLIEYGDLHQELSNKVQRMYEDEIRAAYQDGKESVIIKECAEQSTSEASKYAEGYKEGYKRALELIGWYIKNITNKDNEQR